MQRKTKKKEIDLCIKLAQLSASRCIFMCSIYCVYFYIEYRVVAFRSLPTICYMSVPAWILRKCDMRTVHGGRKNFSLIYLANAYTRSARAVWMTSERVKCDANACIAISHIRTHCSALLCFVYSALCLCVCISMSMCWNNKMKRLWKTPIQTCIQLTQSVCTEFPLRSLLTHTHRYTEWQSYSLSHSLRLLKYRACTNTYTHIHISCWHISLSLFLCLSLPLFLCVSFDLRSEYV